MGDYTGSPMDLIRCYMLDVTNRNLVKLIHIDQSSKESRDRVDRLIQAYKDSPNYDENKKVQITKRELNIDKHSSTNHAQTPLTQIKLLAKRALVDSLREPLRYDIL
jgi:hypothetical protein